MVYVGWNEVKIDGVRRTRLAIIFSESLDEVLCKVNSQISEQNFAGYDVVTYCYGVGVGGILGDYECGKYEDIYYVDTLDDFRKAWEDKE